MYIYLSEMKFLILALVGVCWATPPSRENFDWGSADSLKYVDFFQDPFSEEAIHFINHQSGARWKVMPKLNFYLFPLSRSTLKKSPYSTKFISIFSREFFLLISLQT